MVLTRLPACLLVQATSSSHQVVLLNFCWLLLFCCVDAVLMDNAVVQASSRHQIERWDVLPMFERRFRVGAQVCEQSEFQLELKGRSGWRAVRRDYCLDREGDPQSRWHPSVIHMKS